LHHIIKNRNYFVNIGYTSSSFSVIFLSVTIEKQVKCKTLQWQLKDDQEALLKDDLLQKDQVQEEKQPQEEQLQDLQDLEEKLQNEEDNQNKLSLVCRR
jgi:hypothetical protein